VPLANISNRQPAHINVQEASARFLGQVEATRSQYKRDVDQLVIDNERLQAQRKELQAAKDSAAVEAKRAKDAVDQAKTELADTRAQLNNAKLELEDVKACVPDLTCTWLCDTVAPTW
jgi:chromosome segregation ATPase